MPCGVSTADPRAQSPTHSSAQSATRSPVEILFDRGTLVADLGAAGPGDPGGAGAQGSGVQDASDRSAGIRLPPCFLWDPRVGCWRAPAWRLPDVRAWMDARGLPWTYRSPRPPGFLPDPFPAERLPSLRSYQREALAAWRARGSRGIVCLPTGGGKTRVAIHAVLALGEPALVAVPTRQLLQQWRRAFREIYPGPVGVLGDGEEDIRPITVATYDGASIRADLLGDHFDLLVVDEAHHAGASELQELALLSTARHRLGLSATFAGRGRGERVGTELLGPVCFDLPLADLAGKFLADFEVEILPLPLSREERAAYDRERAAFSRHFRAYMDRHPGAAWLDYAIEAAGSAEGREAMRGLGRSRRVIDLCRAKLSAFEQILDLHEVERKLVFTRDARTAHEISGRFLLPAITSDIDREEREEILRRFERGEYRSIVSARVLNEGLDVPAASVAIILGGSANPVAYAQRIGRVLRAGPGKKARVYELLVPGTSDWKVQERRRRSTAD